MSLSEVKSHMCHFLPNPNPTDLEEPTVVALEEVASVDVLASYLDGEADWDLAALTRGADCGSLPSVCRDYRPLKESC